jgi:hypothetical protein
MSKLNVKNQAHAEYITMTQRNILFLGKQSANYPMSHEQTK